MKVSSLFLTWKHFSFAPENFHQIQNLLYLKRGKVKGPSPIYLKIQDKDIP